MTTDQEFELVKAALQLGGVKAALEVVWYCGLPDTYEEINRQFEEEKQRFLSLLRETFQQERR